LFSGRLLRDGLLIDGDPQSNASLVMLDGRAAADPTLSQVLLDQVEAQDAIRPTRISGLDVLPSDGKLADAASVSLFPVPYFQN